MIRIALCEPISFEGDDLVASLEECAAAQGVTDLRVESFPSPTDLIDACVDIAEDEQPIDIVITSQALAGITGLQVADELRSIGLFDCGMQFVLCAPNGGRAADAAKRGIDGYLLEPVDDRSLKRVVGPIIASMLDLHAHSAVLRCREGVRRLPFSRITYVETTGRDQTIHRRDAGELTVRCSSRALFAYLSKDPRFYKLGSSYIINLDYVDNLQIRMGTVTLFDGISIPAPVRLRTELADAICAHAVVTV